MLEMLDLSLSLPKKEASERLKELSRSVGALQRAFRDRAIASVIVLEGWAASGRGKAANSVILALDPRGYSFHYVEPRAKEEGTLLPYWGLIPPAGRMALFGRSWYHDAWRLGDEALFADIAAFERQLAEAGVFVFKAFLHIDAEEQKNRLKQRRKDRDATWTLEPGEWRQNKEYDDNLRTLERLFNATETEWAPWTVIAAHCGRYAAVTLLEALSDAMTARLGASEGSCKGAFLPETTVHGSRLDSLDYSATMKKKPYRKGLAALQKELHILQIEVFRRKLPVILLFEGVDAAGKGGAIRRLTEALYPRTYEVVPVSAPNDWERAHPYLWRFWRTLPDPGNIVIFDRSWYGRVLVERVEGFCRDDEWRRAYREINEMERHLLSWGAAIGKFWLQISPDEQLRRFESRRDDPERNWKLTDEDWRNREKWPLYQEAAAEMLARTSPPEAPWTIVATDSKRLARITVLETVRDLLVARLQSS
ncbi:MAG: phosphate--AMP phosphotransferase [Synergistaceae bacterium]|nr:phosphate--AMP phosphotransferase [Synergistaceae bacterium]